MNKKVISAVIFSFIICKLIEATCTADGTTAPSSNTKFGAMVKVAYMVPEDKVKYEKAIDQDKFQEAFSMPFIVKTIELQGPLDPVLSSAEAAAEEMPTVGGPPHAKIIYLKIKNHTAYVVLDIDEDGWAGVTYSINRVHPLVQKTLLQFKNIKQVVFSETP